MQKVWVLRLDGSAEKGKIADDVKMSDDEKVIADTLAYYRESGFGWTSVMALPSFVDANKLCLTTTVFRNIARGPRR